ncbi:MAG: ribose 5-phosphate isomerase B [Proteobacteria bacterium]|nr:ribose 5-phosphate isomerase B [Pseudomonadota bacterium]
MKYLKKKIEIYIASDHAGFKLKSKILESYFKDKPNMTIKDLGTYSDVSVDYPFFAQKLCKKIKKDNFGILVCGSGIGVSIAANRFNHVRASLCRSSYDAKMTRKHNNSNVICLSGRGFVKKNIFAMLNTYFNTGFEAGRHLRRINKI